MGQYQEAHQLIHESYADLQSALGDSSQVAGESHYYIALLSLLTADSEEAVVQSDPLLMQVAYPPIPSCPFDPCSSSPFFLLIPVVLLQRYLMQPTPGTADTRRSIGAAPFHVFPLSYLPVVTFNRMHLGQLHLLTLCGWHHLWVDPRDEPFMQALGTPTLCVEARRYYCCRCASRNNARAWQRRVCHSMDSGSLCCADAAMMLRLIVACHLCS